MSGRHPDGKGKLVPMHFAMMALAGSPDGKAEYDSEMASSYLRLISDSGVENDAPEYMPEVSNAEERKVAKLLIEKGFRPEPDPQGNITGLPWPVDIPVIYGRLNIIWERIYMVAIWHTAACRY